MKDALLWLFAVVGGLISLGVAAAWFTWMVDQVRDWRKQPHQRSFYEGRCAAWNELANDAWWFSEDAATMRLLQDLSGAGRGSRMDVNEARERWRKARAEVEATP